jgi:shikimate kinase
MKRPGNLFLIGPMGAGKTTIGKQLSVALGMTFEDSDKEIQRRTGVDIPTIFEFEGEAGFRKRERSVVDELTQHNGIVLATGGGVIVDSDSRRNLSARGVVVYLHCTPEQQYQRTIRDKGRPLLDTDDPMARLVELMAVREPLYRSTADYVVVTEKRSTGAVVKEIQSLLD